MSEQHIEKRPVVLYSIFGADEFVDTEVLKGMAAAEYSQQQLNQLHRLEAERLQLDTFELEYDEGEVLHSGRQFRLNTVFTGLELAERFARLLNIRLKTVVKSTGTIAKFEVRHGRIKNADGQVAGDDRKAFLEALAQVPFFEIQTVWLNGLSTGKTGVNVIFTPRWPKNGGHRQQLEAMARKSHPAITDGDHRQMLVDIAQLKEVVRK
jgi:hypothetical protein